MSDLAHTMLVCGLISGTQPLTLTGMFLVLGGNNGRRNVWWYLFGCFCIQFVIVMVLGRWVQGTVDPTSTAGRSLVALRIAVGVALVILGLWLRRAPSKPAPETPKIFDRLSNVGKGAAFVGGVAIADYQGSMLAAGALATASVTTQQQFLGWALYCLFATGLPVAAALATMHSARAEHDLTRTISWIIRNRRPLSSWICLFVGLALVADGLTTWVTTAT